MELFEMLSSPVILKIFLRAAAVGVCVSICASMLGVTMVLRRMSMIGDGLAHAGFGALAVATLLDATGNFKTEIAIPIVMAASLLLMYISERGVAGDAAIAVVSTGMMTLGVLIFSFTTGYTADMCASLFGSASILTVTNGELAASLILTVIVALAFALFYHKIFAVTFDESFAAATGIHAAFYKIILSLLISVTVVIGMNLIGSVMMSALIVFPALTAMKISKSFGHVMKFAALMSVISFAVGFLASCELSLPVGASVVAVDIVLYAATAAVTSIKNSRKKQREAKKAALS
ncbi:MAG: metal ABC transporter permease [Firmicutes bacterium]|nr:metal ABC transporter permease [Bacillota bacterium]